MDDLFTTAERIEAFAGVLRKADRILSEIYDAAAPEARELIDYDSTLCALDPSTVIALADNLKRIAAALASPAVG